MAQVESVSMSRESLPNTGTSVLNFPVPRTMRNQYVLFMSFYKNIQFRTFGYINNTTYNYCTHYCLKLSGKILFKMERWEWRNGSAVKSTVALAEDLGLVPRTYMVAHNHL